MKKYDETTLKKLQEIELEMLHDFVKICEKNDIQYFGIGGTAIGALRHKGFIPWDDDIDLAFGRKDYEKFCETVEKEYASKYYILNYDKTFTHNDRSNAVDNMRYRKQCHRGKHFQSGN